VRRLAAVGAAAVPLWWLPAAASAHGIGGRQDLPVPLSVFIAAASVVLVVSFVALALLWPTPRFQEPVAPAELEGRWRRPFNLILGIIGLLGFFLVVVGGLAGIDNSSKNPASVLVFVGWWLVIPFLAALLIDTYPAINPWGRVLGRLGVAEGEGGRGYEPAVLVLLGFTWLELVSPRQGPRVLALAALAYLFYLVVVGYRYGRKAVTESFDGFAVYTRLFGSMGPFAIDDEGRWHRRPWLRGLVSVPERSGLDMVAVVLIGTVTYDGAKSSTFWSDSIVAPLVSILPGWSPAVLSAVIGTVGLFGIVGLVGIAYRLACMGAARLGGGSMTGAEVSLRFAHTLIPIGFAYAFAHYFTLILFEGQLLFSTMSDPLGRGWDLFGTVERPVSYFLLGSGTWVWYVQVAVIVFGHVAGVVLAHDRALTDFAGPKAIRSQYAMLGLMIALTGLGLTLLAAG
jgi:hypothetical protein